MLEKLPHRLFRAYGEKAFTHGEPGYDLNGFIFIRILVCVYRPADRVGKGDAQTLFVRRYTCYVPRLETVLVYKSAGGDDAGYIAFHDTLGCGRILYLLTYRDLLSGLDQA